MVNIVYNLFIKFVNGISNNCTEMIYYRPSSIDRVHRKYDICTRKIVVRRCYSLMYTIFYNITREQLL